MYNISKKVFIPLLVGIVCFTFVLIGKNNVSADEPTGSGFTVKSQYDNLNDGWIYYFKIVYPETGGDKSYVFNGYNLKYKEMDGYSIPVVDRKTKEVVELIKPNYVSLINSEVHRQDLINIKDFFNEKQFDRKINVEDIKDLNFDVVSKEYLVDLFNKTIESSKERQDGKYANASFFDIKTIDSTEKDLDGKWQVAYILKNGDLYDVNIEFISSDGNYISDTQTMATKNNNDKSLFEEIEKIEDLLIKNQSLSLENNVVLSSNENSKINLNKNVDLSNLLNEIQKDLTK